MRTINALGRYLATPAVSKYRIFRWLEPPLLPDHALIVFSRSDDYFMGIMQSRVHELWALKLGTRLETRPRYTPTTCFETFPFPDPAPAMSATISGAAKALDDARELWLRPHEWTREEELNFPGSVDGPWTLHVYNPDRRGIGTVRYARRIPKDAECAAKLAKRTLTALYNQRPAWLDLAHRKLDDVVLAAYGWKPELTDDEILSRLLVLNLERAAKGSAVLSMTADVPIVVSDRNGTRNSLT